MKRKFNPGTRTVHFTFDQPVNPTDPAVPELVFHLDKCSAAIQAEFTGAGVIQRLGDAAAIKKDESNGFRVTEAMRRAAMVPLAEHYESGTEAWEMRGGSRAPVLNPMIQQLAEKMGKTYAEAQAWFAEKLTAELAAE